LHDVVGTIDPIPNRVAVFLSADLVDVILDGVSAQVDPLPGIDIFSSVLVLVLVLVFVLTKIARPSMTVKEGRQAQAIARLISMMTKMVGAKVE